MTALGRNIFPVTVTKDDARSGAWPPDSWACQDCGINTAPGLLSRQRLKDALAADWANQGVEQHIDEFSEVYMVKPAIWRVAGMQPFSGCLCVACLERRLGRRLTPRDFLRNHDLNSVPGTERLLERRGDAS